MNSTELQEKIGYTFKNLNLLNQALTHISYANENDCAHYERLEFLGDAVVELCVSNYIFENFDLGAGDLSKLRASLVSTENLNSISTILNLESFILKSNSLPKISKKTNADLFESVVGAVYLDGGLDKASEIVNKFVIMSFENVKTHLENSSDVKTSLQELLQKEGRSWEYKTINSYGLDHEKTFVVALFIDNILVSEGEAKNIHDAQNVCAKKYLESIK